MQAELMYPAGRMARLRAMVLRTGGDGAFLVANNLLVAGAGFLFWVLAARVAAPDVIGVATAIVGSIMLLGNIAKLGIEFSLLSVLPRASPADARRFLNGATTISGGGALIAAAVFISGINVWSPSLTGWLWSPGAASGFGVLCALYTYGFILDFYFTARRRSDLALVKNLIHAAVRLPAVLILGPLFGVAGVVVAAVGSMLVALVPSVFWMTRIEGALPRYRLEWPYLRGILPSSAANYVSSILLTVPVTVGALIVLEVYGAEAAARFYIVWLVGSLAVIAPSALSFVLIVDHSSGRATGDSRRWLLVIAGALGVALFGPLALFFVGPEYADGGFFALLPYALAALPAYVYQDHMAVFRAQHRLAPVVALPIVLVTLFLAWLALPFPIELAGWGWFLANAAGAIGGRVWRRAQLL